MLNSQRKKKSKEREGLRRLGPQKITVKEEKAKTVGFTVVVFGYKKSKDRGVTETFQVC